LDLVNIFPPKGSPYGLTYEEHIKNYWKFIISIPADQNPVNDETGEKSVTSQINSSSSVFYLADSRRGKTERTCTIPSGKGVLIPVMVVEVSDKERPNAPLEELQKMAKKDQDSVSSLYLKIDSKEYDSAYLDGFRTHTDAFNVVFPENAIYNAPPGKSTAVADGHYIITDVLSKGKHEIHFKSSLTNQGEDCLEPNFETDVKYTLIVE
jgi:hypothetical protein